jgi:hypothetical protein
MGVEERKEVQVKGIENILNKIIENSLNLGKESHLGTEGF